MPARSTAGPAMSRRPSRGRSRITASRPGSSSSTRPTGSRRPEYATETARINSLGADDALVLVALGDRTDAIWVAEGLDAITDAEIDAIIAGELEPRAA